MNHALSVLEFTAVRDRLAFHCETALGAVSASELEPAYENDSAWERLNQTTEAYNFLSQVPAPSLGGVKDLRDSLTRASKGGSLGGVELYQVGESLAAMRNFKASIEGKKHDFKHLWNLAGQFPELKLLEDQLFSSLDGGGDVKDGASQELGRLRQRKHSATSRILERIQSYTSGKSREFLSDPIYTVRDGRYVVPVKSEYRGRVRGIVHDTSGSGQTLFVEPEDVLQLGNALREIEAAEREEMRRILAELSSKVGKNAGIIELGIEASGELDTLLAKAKLAFEMKASKPRRWQGVGINIQAGRHPLLDRNIAVPIDIVVGFDFEGLLITGPNTGGKTVAIKTVGLFVLMAQAGLYLPAIDVKLGVFSQVWADIGDEQSLQQSLSTFSGHIKNIAEALKLLKPGALVLFDEIGAGTDPAEGAALAKSILLTLKERGAFIVASTHYGELKAFAYSTPGYRNASLEFDVKSLRPTYRVLMGSPGASHALRIAERYGLPKEVIERAYAGLSVEAQQVSKMMEELELAQRRARNAQSEADKRVAEIKKAEQRAQQKLEEAEDIRKNVHAKAAETIETALREIRAEAAEIFEDLKTSPNADANAQAREKLKGLQSFGQSVAKEFEEKAPKQKPNEATLSKGMRVKVEGYPQPGNILEEPKNGNVVVQLGPLRVTVSTSKVSPTEEKFQQTVKAKPNMNLHRAQTATMEIHLRMMRAEEAIQELERFVDDALLAGLPQVRIVHGKGEGVLRKITQDYLRRNKDISRFRDGEATEGGQGVTIAYLK
ncbi:MAG TPA: endonuclease MutS2 [Fimbriimonadaceae bacterium]|jgi:DNA mismatch repair protein MutS2